MSVSEIQILLYLLLNYTKRVNVNGITTINNDTVRVEVDGTTFDISISVTQEII